jgi:hypothetical protein
MEDWHGGKRVSLVRRYCPKMNVNLVFKEMINAACKNLNVGLAKKKEGM